MLCKLFSSLRTTLNDDEIYYCYYYHDYIYDTIRKLIIMVATVMMMVTMMMMNCDSCCLIVPLTILLTGAQVKNLINQHTKKPRKKSLNKSLRAAWPRSVCSGPVSHVLFCCPSPSCHAGTFVVFVFELFSPLNLLRVVLVWSQVSYCKYCLNVIHSFLSHL